VTDRGDPGVALDRIPVERRVSAFNEFREER